jgi:hypothetical protein
MLHKANTGRRHHIPWPKRCMTSWSDYNKALRQRVSPGKPFSMMAPGCFSRNVSG